MNIRNVLCLLSVALVATAITPSLKADAWDKKTVITIDEPVQIPSCCNAEHTVVLQPGTYVLALVDSMSDRHIVRVFAQDQTTVITTILATPNYRLQPTGQSVFQFWETPAGQPRAIRAWFYPGDNFGQEFAYHKAKALEIAKIANVPVPSVAVETEAELKTAPMLVVNEKDEEKPAETLVASSDLPVQPAPTKLPDTGSEYPLFGLIGIASVIVSRLMSRVSKRA